MYFVNHKYTTVRRFRRSDLPLATARNAKKAAMAETRREEDILAATVAIITTSLGKYRV